MHEVVELLESRKHADRLSTNRRLACAAGLAIIVSAFLPWVTLKWESFGKNRHNGWISGVMELRVEAYGQTVRHVSPQQLSAPLPGVQYRSRLVNAGSTVLSLGVIVLLVGATLTEQSRGVSLLAAGAALFAYAGWKIVAVRQLLSEAAAMGDFLTDAAMGPGLFVQSAAAAVCVFCGLRQVRLANASPATSQVQLSKPQAASG